MKTNGQQAKRPEICNNPPVGYELGGSFSPNPNVACLVENVNNTGVIILFSNPAGIDKGSEEYLFNYKDGDSLIFTKENRYSADKEGIYWFIQRGTITEGDISKKVLVCKSIEVIRTKTPDLDYSTCGPKTINIVIKDTPDNQKQSGYIIKWDAKNVSTYKPTKLPYLISYTYSEIPSSLPLIQGLYERYGIMACHGNGLVIPARDYFTIPKLESLNYGKEVKIQMQGGTSEKEYYIQYKLKTVTEWTESTTKIKRNTTDTLATATISGLESSAQYCFRLVEKDTCNYTISYSNEMCTPLVLSTESAEGIINISPNPTEEKILIKSSGAPVRLVELIDTRGRMIHRGEISDDTFTLSAFAKGKYILRLYDGNHKLLNTKNIVKW